VREAAGEEEDALCPLPFEPTCTIHRPSVALIVVSHPLVADEKAWGCSLIKAMKRADGVWEGRRELVKVREE
jgi:hypothetical protein